MTEQERTIKRLKAHLNDLTNNVMSYLRYLDCTMKEPDSFERGKKIAKLSNALEMANDQARYFGLGVNYRTDKKPIKEQPQ